MAGIKMNGALILPTLQLDCAIVGAAGVTLDGTTGGAGLELPPPAGGPDEQPVARAKVWVHEVGGVRTTPFLPTAVIVTVVPAGTLTVPAEAAMAAPLLRET